MICAKHLADRLLVVVVATLVAAPAAAVPMFTGLGDLPGGTFESQASDVSADGGVVVGTSVSADGGEAFRWTESDGMVGLADLPGGIFRSVALGVSADGEVVVGQAQQSGSGADGAVAFRWTAGGMGSIGDLPGGATNGAGEAASGDGGIVVGFSSSTDAQEAFRWTAEDGMVGLGGLDPNLVESQALDISADGNVIVGNSDGLLGNEAFRWTEQDGMIGLGDLAGGSFSSMARAASADGSVIVGAGTSSQPEAFFWRADIGMTGLGTLGGSSSAWGVSGDGTVVVGRTGDGAFIWTQADGMRELQQLLEDMGLDLTGWTLNSADSISADGLTIVGTGLNPAGDREAYLARIPEPSTASLLGVALAGIALLRRRLSCL